ncbi:MAG: polyhydroxyalkanoic acid system protein [Sphingobacteriia bacterium]|nr:polyhydroxyalkanoic acid system protein [Sphingobacteriia bacterium]NCC40342.1 polyhydroxyalkanoic acid system protein [Gammaproteobacteria bacterium]
MIEESATACDSRALTQSARSANNRRMIDIIIEREHHLELEQARNRIAELAELLGRELDARCVWRGDQLDFKRLGASGSIQVSARQVRLQVRLGFFLKPLRAEIEHGIRERLDRIIPIAETA